MIFILAFSSFVSRSPHRFILHHQVCHMSSTPISISILSIFLIVSTGDLNQVKTLVDEGVTPDRFIYLAAQYGNIEMVKYLVSHGADINFVHEGATPLCAAAPSDLEMVKCLVSLGADVNTPTAQRKRPLGMAAQEGQIDIVKYLVDVGADVNVLFEKETSLFSAAYDHHTQVLRYLFDQLADINVCSRPLTCTPLVLAIITKDLELVDYCVSRGAYLNGVAGNSQLPLHVAVCEGSIEIVRYLIDHGVDVNALCTLGDTSGTALHAAIQKQQLEACKHLVDCGADMRIVDKNQCTVLHLSATLDDTILSYILEHLVNDPSICYSTVPGVV